MGFMKKLAVIFGLMLLAFILLSIDLVKLVEILLLLDVGTYLSALLLLVVLIFSKGIKWKLVLNSQGFKIPVFDAVKYFLIGFFFSAVTPGRVGEVTRAVYIRKKAGLPLALSSVVLDKLIDIILLVVFAFTASIAFIFVYNMQIFPAEVFLIAALLLAVAIFFLFNEKYLKIIARPVFHMLVPEEMKGKLSTSFSEFFSSLKIIFNNKKKFLYSVLFGVLFWFFAVVFSFMLANSIGIRISIEFMFLVYPLLALSDIIPISVSGLGTREAIAVFLFSLLALSAEQAVAFSLLLFLTGYLLVAFVGYLFFISEPIELKTLIKPNN